MEHREISNNVAHVIEQVESLTSDKITQAMILKTAAAQIENKNNAENARFAIWKALRRGENRDG